MANNTYNIEMDKKVIVIFAKKIKHVFIAS